MKLNLKTVRFAQDARRRWDGATLSVNGLYSITAVNWLRAAEINFSSITALRLADLERLPSNNTMVSVNARTLQDVRKNHEEKRKDDRRGRFISKIAPIGQHVKVFKK